VDEVTDFFGNGRPARRAALAEVSPVIPKPFLLPGNHGARLYELQSVLPPWPQTGQPGPEKPIRRMKFGTLDGVLVDGELMA
jgi:hypothetical protein